jgi:3-hydroxyisobutyrate dehydrogenase-like beta-hydroxyacid dehydrogenase
MAIAGQYHAKKRVSHALCPAVVRKVMDLGSDVERAAKFKLTGNAMVLGCIELLAETTTLADQSGVGAEKVSFLKGYVGAWLTLA